jgi:hypothetical protein
MCEAPGFFLKGSINTTFTLCVACKRLAKILPFLYTFFGCFLKPLCNGWLELVQVEEDVIRSLDDRGRPTHFTTRRLQFRGIDETTTLVALVTSGILVCT